MFSISPMKDLYESPMPPMALTDYEAMSKFLNRGAQRCKASGRNFDLFLDWVIHALTQSLTADSASRIFLPKTRTCPFELDDLIPLSPLRSQRRQRVQLRETNLIAPVWNNSDLESALEAFYDSGFAGTDLEEVFGGVYIQELPMPSNNPPPAVTCPKCVGSGDPYGRSVQLRPAALRRQGVRTGAPGSPLRSAGEEAPG